MLVNNPKNNIIAVIIFEIITLAITFTADYSGAGMAKVIIKWIPALIGVSTLIIYFVSRLFTKKYNWIISVVGIAAMLFAAIKIYLTDFTQTL